MSHSRPVPKIKIRHKTKGALRKKKHYANNQGQNWLESQDMEELKYRFFREVDDDGTYTFSSVRSFARTIAKEQGKEEIRKWLRKAIGPRECKSIIHQGDWEMERHLEEGKFDAVADSIKKKLTKEMDLLGAGMDIAGSYTVWRSRAERLAMEVDTLFGGRGVLERPDKKMNSKEREKWEKGQSHRMRMYLSSLREVLSLKMSIDKMMLDAMGWNRPQILALMKGASDRPNGSPDSQALQPSRLRQLFGEVIEMQMEKSKMYGLELPEELANLADVADEEERRLLKARNVNGNGGGNGNGHGKSSSKEKAHSHS